MYRVDRNNYNNNEKKATIYTPEKASNFIFDILKNTISKDKIIFDPCVGQGSLLKPFDSNGYKTLGLDIENQGYRNTIIYNYLEIEKGMINEPGLVIMNPPFNIDNKTKEYIKENYSGRPLLPEVWLQKTIELFGKNIPILMFCPYGFRLNQSLNSARWQKFNQGIYPQISSIISLPKDLFKDIQFHSEILMFNIEGVKPHYFYN